MILVAESGSTKTQWCILTPTGIEKLVNTPGINPVLMSYEEIQGVIRPVLAGLNSEEVESIYYFGAGCANQKYKEKVGKVLFSIFECNELWIDSDLIAACLALSGDFPSVIGLLGTGSNSCLWNGSAIQQQTPSLGYILGDEGGGTSIGKQLVADFLKQQMPADLFVRFSERYDVSLEIVIERVYQMQMPNQYLAAFAPFVEEHFDHEYCQNLITRQFENFIQRNILNYENAYELPIQFCGTIGWCHQEELRKVCSQFGLNAGRIIKEPIDNLASYLWEKKFPTT